MRPCPVFARYTVAFALQLRRKHGKTKGIQRKWYSSCICIQMLFISRRCHCLRLVSNGRMINEWWIRKDVKEGGRGLFLCIISSLTWKDGEKPRSLCQGGQCRGLAAGRLDFVTSSCQPWLTYTTNVRSACAVGFYQPVCFYLPPLFMFTCRMFVLTQMALCHFCYPILYVLFHPCIESMTTIWLTYLFDFFSFSSVLFDSTYLWT